MPRCFRRTASSSDRPGDWSNLPRRGTDVDFGVHLPLISFAGEERSLADLIAFTEAARDLGYTHLCANDHLVFSRAWLDGVGCANSLSAANRRFQRDGPSLPTPQGHSGFWLRNG